MPLNRLCGDTLSEGVRPLATGGLRSVSRTSNYSDWVACSWYWRRKPKLTPRPTAMPMIVMLIRTHIAIHIRRFSTLHILVQLFSYRTMCLSSSPRASCTGTGSSFRAWWKAGAGCGAFAQSTMGFKIHERYRTIDGAEKRRHSGDESASRCWGVFVAMVEREFLGQKNLSADLTDIKKS